MCAVVIASCSRGAQTASPPGEVSRPLATLAVQRLVVTPTARVSSADTQAWAQRLGGTRTAARLMDSTIAAVLEARALAERWVLPDALERAHERNRTYAPDPHLLAVEPLRSGSFVAGRKYGEPLASQLRAMIAMQEDARLVLVPVELRFEPVGAGSASRAVLRTAILDPRFAEAMFVADVRGDTTSVPERALASVASKLADLFVAP
jgi:hypothetical protein